MSYQAPRIPSKQWEKLAIEMSILKDQGLSYKQIAAKFDTKYDRAREMALRGYDIRRKKDREICALQRIMEIGDEIRPYSSSIIIRENLRLIAYGMRKALDPNPTGHLKTL